MLKILVLGNTGMLGHIVYGFLKKNSSFKVDGTNLNCPSDFLYFNAATDFDKLNIMNQDVNGYDYLINCIGITQNKIDVSNSDSIIQGIKINSLFPHQLADFSIKNNIKVLHISTDGVFSPDYSNVDESVSTNCIDLYGRTKALGEVLGNKNFINIRCSIIGPSPYEKGGLLEWFLSQRDNSVIFGYTNHFWNGGNDIAVCRNVS